MGLYRGQAVELGSLLLTNAVPVADSPSARSRGLYKCSLNERTLSGSDQVGAM